MSNEEKDKLNIDSQDEEWEISGNDESDSNDIHFEIMNYPADTTLKGYKDQWNNNQLKIPSFQRKYVWDQITASRLIESFLLGLTVPGIFLYKERNSSEYLVIDGNQRINTIVSFFNSLFREKRFRLKGVNKKWEGKSFEDLTDEEKFKLETTVMRSTVIQQLNPNDTSSIYHIFERLNTGGVKLTPMEVRMCLSEGKFVKNILTELNENPNWRTKLLHKQKEHPRSKDKELILRILALSDEKTEYISPMKKFLNNYLEKNKNPSDEIINLKKEAFLKAVGKAIYLDPKPFHPFGTLNFSVIDSILVALITSPLNDATKISNAYKNLMRKERYIELVKRGKTSKPEVIERLEIAKDIFNHG